VAARVAQPLTGSRVAGAPVGTARLSARVPARATRRQALSVLGGDGRAAWLGDPVGQAADVEHDRYLLDLELRVSEQTPRLTFRKAAYVDVGPPRTRRTGPIEVPISWRAAGLAPLFPVFSGTLTWADNELSVDGYYAPPGGEVGIVADRLLLNVAARGTARLLLERIAAVIRGAPG
jgi:hypothetical protein